jgi:hypothetical protein
MTVDDSMTSPLTSEQRTFTVQHDQILHAVVEQLNEVTARLHALEAEVSAQASATSLPTIDVTDRSATPIVESDARDASPISRTKSGRQTGWQPTRR